MQASSTGNRYLAAFTVLTLFAGCAAQSFRAGEACVTPEFTVVDRFSGARRGTCTVLSENSVRLDIRPESDGKINDSPWYAFKLLPSSPTTAQIILRYHNGHHRYWPKISTDGRHWEPIADEHVRESNNGRQAFIDVPLTSHAVWVSAQEILAPRYYNTWMRSVADNSGISVAELGQSTRGLPIQMLDSNSDASDILLLIGRQHPPEVTGAIAFLTFAETIFDNSALATQFRQRFRVIAIPLVNPDGVVGGNWRHNLDDTDLNRDWGLFRQPETRHVGALLDELDDSGAALRMFIDFHSTQHNVFYTQEARTTPPEFTASWLGNSRSRIHNYSFQNDRSPGTNPTVSKNYIYDRYGIPAVTFEVGDETDRSAIRDAARIFAQELMKLMLNQEY